MKSILVFSHNHNSFDKKKLLEHKNVFITLSEKKPSDFVKETDILHFFMNDIDKLLEDYDPGDPKYKPDVLKQIHDLTKQREDEHRKQIEYQETLHKIQSINNPQFMQEKMNELYKVVNDLTIENNKLKSKNAYLEDKMKQLITEKIQQKLQHKIQDTDLTKENDLPKST